MVKVCPAVKLGAENVQPGVVLRATLGFNSAQIATEPGVGMSGTHRFRVVDERGVGNAPGMHPEVRDLPPQVEYLSDMLLEMEGLAKGLGAETLAELLIVARNEAMRFRPSR